MFSKWSIWFTFISFSSSNRTKLLEEDNCLVHMQIWCILASCSEGKVYLTSAFQLMLVIKIKKWLHLLLRNFSSRWNNSTRYKNFGDSLKQLKTTLSYLQNWNSLKNLTQKHLLKKAKTIKFNVKNLFASSIHSYLFDSSIWTFMKIKCNRTKCTLLTSYRM